MGTTAEKLTYLNTTKQKIKDAINNIGGNITSETTFRQYVAALESIYQSMPKVSGSGTTLSLTPTLKGLMQIDLKGNTSQEGTPTPDNPQDIHNVSGDNDIVVCGKNLFDKDSVVGGFVNADGTIGGDTNAYRTSDFIPIQPNTAYYKTYTASPRTKFYDSNKQPLNTTTYQDISIGGNEGTFTTPNNAYYFRFSYPKASVDENTIQLEKGETATTYEAYTGATYPINLPSGMELCKIGTYQDYFYKDSGKWYLHKEIGKVVLNGSETGLSYDFNCLRILNSTFKTFETTEIGEIYSNYYTKNKQETLQNNVVDYGISYRGAPANGMVIRNKDITSLNDFKTWLSTHNTIINYILATPTNTEITDTTLIEQLDILESAKSKNGTTNINQENNDLPFILDVSCLKGE